MAADGDACRARLLLLGDPDYPPSLMELTDPPPFLFSYGDLSLLTRPAVAIVGTRRATPYGERVTDALAGTLAAAGICVVSGMARGIDGAAHRGALAVAAGRPAAVVGNGPDRPYPRVHTELWGAVCERGGTSRR